MIAHLSIIYLFCVFVFRFFQFEEQEEIEFRMPSRFSQSYDYDSTLDSPTVRSSVSTQPVDEDIMHAEPSMEVKKREKKCILFPRHKLLSNHPLLPSSPPPLLPSSPPPLLNFLTSIFFVCRRSIPSHLGSVLHTLIRTFGMRTLIIKKISIQGNATWRMTSVMAHMVLTKTLWRDKDQVIRGLLETS